MIRYDSALKELLTAFLFGQPGLSVYAFCRKQDNYLAAVSICLKQKQKQKKRTKNFFFPMRNIYNLILMDVCLYVIKTSKPSNILAYL